MTSKPSGHPVEVPDTEMSQTFARGLEVIRAFDGSHQEMTIAEIANRLSYSRAATRRLIRTLEWLGYVVADRQRYRLTPRVLQLGLGFLQSRSVGHLVGPVLREESLIAKEPISLALLDGEHAIYVSHVPTTAQIKTFGHTIGSALPLTTTAIGQAILAFMRRPDVERLAEVKALSREAHQHLMGSLAVVAKDGFALLRNSLIDGVVAIAVPAFNAEGRPVGALGVVAASNALTDGRIAEEIVPTLKRAAEYIATAL